MSGTLANVTTPGWQAWFVLALLAVVVAMFAREKPRVDLAALLGIVALLLARILTPDQAFAGFGSPVIITLASVFVLGGALRATGVLDAVGAWVMRRLGQGEAALTVGLMAVAAGLSAVMNNTTVTAMLTPLTLGLARKAGLSPSRLLMPIAFASILGGTCTLIGTSTNLAVSGFIAQQDGLAPIGLFEITPVGLVLVGSGMLLLATVGRALLPRPPQESLAEAYDIRGYLSEIVVMPGSPLAGQSVAQSDLARMEFRILKIIRRGRALVPDAETRLETKDLLLVRGDVAALMKVKQTEGIEIRGDLKLGDADLRVGGQELAEVVVSPQSPLIDRTLKEARFQQDFGLTVLALFRRGRALRHKLSSIRFKAGDLLLVQGRPEAVAAVNERRELALLSLRGTARRNGRPAWLAVGLFAGALALGGVGLVGMPVAFLLAALGVVLAGCVPVTRLYELVEWRLLVLIGAMLAFGTAMTTTGAADLLAAGVVRAVGPFGPRGILAGFALLTILLTQPMSNAAAALVVLPVALTTANQAGLDPRTLAIGIMLAASLSFVTPFEPSCILVYGPGKYRFRDFVKVGALQTLLSFVLVVWLVPEFWPLARAR